MRLKNGSVDSHELSPIHTAKSMVSKTHEVVMLYLTSLRMR